jgi:hypothetical protein
MALCIRCHKEPRKTGQRYCKGCHALYMREWRSRYSGLDKTIRQLVREHVSRETRREQAAREIA